MPQSHYPGFDVLTQADEWDAHTRDVVLKRVGASPPLRHLQPHEADTLRAVIRHLLYENRPEPLDFVLRHFDDKLAPGDAIGEAQRPVGAPPERDLLRRGLAGLDSIARQRHKQAFAHCTVDEQFAILSTLQKGKLESAPTLANLPQKALFKKLLGLAVEAYASFPAVWSEMGYAGPAYPRGYYRIERGVTDPWEPRREGTEGVNP